MRFFKKDKGTEMTENVEQDDVKASGEKISEQAEEVAVDNSAQAEQPSESPAEKKAEEDFRAKYYYLAAEMDNMQKRFHRERENLVKYGNEKILSSLIEIIDSFDHTLKAIELDRDEKVQNICKGILWLLKNQTHVLLVCCCGFSSF